MELKTNRKNIPNKRKPNLNNKLGKANFVTKQMSQFMKDGDVAAITDLIASYTSNSPKYKNQASFAKTIGTSSQTLKRMLSHSNKVSLKVFSMRSNRFIVIKT